MAQITVWRPCPVCGDKQAHQGESVSHGLHLILSIITAGLWIPVWILIAAMVGSTNARIKGEECKECRRERLHERRNAFAATQARQ